MATFRPDSQDSGLKDANNKPIFVPIPSLLATETRVRCPRCGSPYVATFTTLEPRAKAMSGFACSAGDCSYTGAAVRAA